tara:strand:- start:4176 stop:4754 length:579 start_codon:yes stop_codon:yes gene_type:complete
MVLGVSYSAAIYPGYSHVHQAMSELHAVGSPIASIAPFINHYPLAILFAGFGYFVATFFDSGMARFSGILIIAHGVATFTAGYFPCDLGCNPENTSTTQVLHGVSGLVILFTLLMAPAIWSVIAKRELQLRWFAWLSTVVVLGQLLVMIPTIQAMRTGENFGVYQRLAYSIPLIWLFVFAVLLSRKTSAKQH